MADGIGDVARAPSSRNSPAATRPEKIARQDGIVSGPAR
jgi:hypothetical protein